MGSPDQLGALAYALVFAASVLGGAVNAVAAGGILLTFPVLVVVGLSPLAATATSTLALWPGNLSSVFGYRHELAGARDWALRFAVPSILGGAAGGLLLLRTPASRFAELVPFLVLGATLLFMLQPLVLRARGLREATDGLAAPPHVAHVAHDAAALAPALAPPPPHFLALQFVVAIYGGYFGAGAGILMLASLGLMGLRNIHQMNGLKNWGALCFNLTAAILFVADQRVHWPLALTMGAGTVVGAYGTAGVARRLPQPVIRGGILAAGLLSAAWLLVMR